MKRSLSLVCVLASGLGVVAVAQAAPPSAEPTAAAASVPITGATKIGVINFQQAVGQTNEFQRDLADLRKKYEPREQSLQQQNTEIEGMKKQLQTAGQQISDADRQTRLRTIDDKTKSLQRSAEDLRNDEQTDGQETFQQVGQKVYDVMVSYAQQQGFGLVLDASQQNSGVLWPSPQSDITKVVVEAYNAKSGIPAPTSVPSAPAPHAGNGPSRTMPHTTPH
ncbi:MAG TPA: OmpH family outer membrane protein [Acidobacteriaceae bacterium]|jgi:outer membrane protein|nr:OmpH family outer membrane protein [Acidobacteriaceae bacterium]